MFRVPSFVALLILSLAGLQISNVSTGAAQQGDCADILLNIDSTGSQGLDSSDCASNMATPPPAIVCDQLIVNPDFDAPDDDYFGWEQNLYLTSSFTDKDDVIRDGAWLGGAEQTDQYLYQDVAIPSASTSAELSYYWALNPPSPAEAPLENSEAMTMTVRSSDNATLQTIQVIGDDSERRLWVQDSFDLDSYIGQEIRLFAEATTRSTTTSWYLDHVTIQACTAADLPYQLYQPLIWK